MGLCEILTVVFVICKLVGVTNWSWFQVFIPMYIAVTYYLILLGIFIKGFLSIKR